MMVTKANGREGNPFPLFKRTAFKLVLEESMIASFHLFYVNVQVHLAKHKCCYNTANPFLQKTLENLSEGKKWKPLVSYYRRVQPFCLELKRLACNLDSFMSRKWSFNSPGVKN